MSTPCNRLNLSKVEYGGLPSTLCKGCGHDSITAALIQSYYDLGVKPHGIMKMSGIGCSSKTPTYFLNQSHGFNGVHGRMPSLATGAKLANHTMPTLGISGDGDSASIGMGQFTHLIRRNLDMVYLIENNGTYGLTKGQFSATADEGSKAKRGFQNPFPTIDLAALAIQLGASFVARSFSGDRKQLLTLLKAAHSHKGTAILDVISPCVTFNNHEGSTKSYLYVKEHDVPVHELGYVPFFEEIEVEMQEGTTRDVKLHDGSTLTLKKLDRDYDITHKARALTYLEEAAAKGEVVTGLLYLDADRPALTDICALGSEPLRDLDESDLDPGPQAIEAFNAALR